MPLETKIVLSDKELALVKEGEWILTKQVIIQKVFEILNQGVKVIDEEILVNTVETPVFKTDYPKIYKGENYLGLPYVTLDYPRSFKKEDIFALRTMFWWSKFFSITFHVGGSFKKWFLTRLKENHQHIPAEFHICIHEEQWHHHFETDNYIPVQGVSLSRLDKILNEKDFIKLSLKYDLKDINDMQHLLSEGYKTIGKMITNYPGGETILLPDIPKADFDL
ncbi:MAG: hypothetical protein WKF35_00560 [Ferruginibacter sp.]